jgi:WD40 repeat protein
MDNDDNTIVLWDLSEVSAAAASGDMTEAGDEFSIEPIGLPIRGHQDWLTALTFSNDGRHLASADRSGRLFLWDVTDAGKPGEDGTGYESRILSADGPTIWDLAFSPDGPILASGDGEGRITLWDVVGQNPLATRIEGPGGRVTTVALDPEGTTLAVGGGDGSVTWFDADYNSDSFGKLLSQGSITHTGAVRKIDYRSDGSLLASSGQDGTIIFWDPGKQNPAPFGPIKNPYDVWYIDFSHDGDKLAASGVASVVRIWEVSSGDLLLELAINEQSTYHGPGGVSSAAVNFGPEGNFLATSTRRGVILWDLKRIAESNISGVIPFPADESGGNFGKTFDVGPTRSLDFSSDGKLFASGNLNTGIILQDAMTGQELAPPLSLRQGEIAGITFIPDQNSLVSVGVDGQVIFWDLNAESESYGQNYGPALDGRALGDLPSVSFNKDGSRLATRHTDGSITLWRLDVASWKTLACRRAGRNMTPTEWRQYFGEEPYQHTCSEYG